MVERALQALLAAGDPLYELPPATAAHTRHCMPLDRLEKGTWKTTLVVDAFMALAPGAELRVFWDAELGEAERAALDAAARRAGHLGRSESLCEARLLPAQALPAALGAWPEELTTPEHPTAHGVATLMGVMPEQDVALLETDVMAMRKEERLIPEGTRRVRYATVESPPRRAVAVDASEAPTLAVLRIAGNALPDITRAVVVATVLRSALQRRFDHDSTGWSSPVLSGHVASGPSERQHRHAHYLALPDATGARIDRFVVWAPDGLGPEELRALASLTWLPVRELPEPLRLSLVSVGSAEQASAATHARRRRGRR